MKRITLIGIIIVAIVAIVAFVTALDMGEKSPIYAAGELELPQEFRDAAVGMNTMFVIIFDEDSPMPMPYGAMKERLGSELPSTIHFSLTKEKLQIMRPDAPAPKYLRLKVRLDKDGVAGPDQPGDLVGIIEHVPFGKRGVKLSIQQKI